MTKVAIRTLDSVTNNDTTATQLINENFQALQTAIENTLSRDGTTPNFMDANLDLNSYKIINAGMPTDNTDVITKEYFDQNIGDAAGYAAAAASSAQQASTFASSASSYAIVATSAANIAQAARDFIESDPGFITVSTDLQRGVNGSIYKVNANKANIDTVASNIANVNTVAGISTDVSKVAAIDDDVTDVANIDSDVITVASIQNAVVNVSNIESAVLNVSDDRANIDTVAQNINNVNTVGNNIANVNRVSSNITNVNRVGNDITNVNKVADDIANVNTVSNSIVNVNKVGNDITKVNAVADDIANINAVAADLTNIDAASGYAAEAKQWAIGEPTEPVGNSSKYWADYAERIAEGVGNPANRDLSNLTATGELKFSNLQSQIDAIVSSSDVFDIVGTYAELQTYDISSVPVNDIIKVLVDSTHSGAATYYRCVENGGVKSWSYIGSEGAYYTKGEADALLAGRANTNLSNLSTTGQAVLDAKQDEATSVNYDNISNCITEIPQDIKLELNNGTLTLKAGSKGYMGNGTVRTITGEPTLKNTGAAQMFLHITSGGTGLYAGYMTGGTVSERPSSPINYATYYNTSTQKCEYYNGSTWNEISLPIAIVTRGIDGFVSIDQVFNGFGYIGSTVFALPGVKGLIPNGRNADGTLKNTEFTYTTVKTVTNTVYRPNAHIDCLVNSIAFRNTLDYNEELNLNWQGSAYTNAEGDGGKVTTSSTSPYAITSLTPKTAFHAVDYNDFSDLKDIVDAKANDSDVVKLTGNQNISGNKTFTDQIFYNRANDARIRTIAPNLTNGTTPSATQWTGIDLMDKNKVEMAQHLAYVDNTGTAISAQWVRVSGTTTTGFGVRTVGNTNTGAVETYAITPATSDNSSKIATTAFVNNKHQLVSALPASPSADVFYYIPEN